MIPENVVGNAAKYAIERIKDDLKATGIDVSHVLVLVHADEVPEGCRHSGIAGYGFKDEADMVLQVGLHFETAVAAHGKRVKWIEVPRG